MSLLIPFKDKGTVLCLNLFFSLMCSPLPVHAGTLGFAQWLAHGWAGLRAGCLTNALSLSAVFVASSIFETSWGRGAEAQEEGLALQRLGTSLGFEGVERLRWPHPSCRGPG